MKKKIFYFVWAILLLFLGTGFGEDPEGFRGIKWGANKSEVDGLSCSEITKDDHLYTRKEEKKIGDIEVNDINYIFYKNQFCGAMIDFKGYSDFAFLKDALSEKYGRGKRPNQFLEQYIWKFENVLIFMDYSKITHAGKIVYGYLHITEQRSLDTKEKGRKAKDDL